MNRQERVVSIVIISVVLVSLLIYLVLVYISYKKDRFIFSPYTPPPLSNGFQPLGKVTPLTEQEQQERYDAYTRPAK